MNDPQPLKNSSFFKLASSEVVSCESSRNSRDILLLKSIDWTILGRIERPLKQMYLFYEEKLPIGLEEMKKREREGEGERGICSTSKVNIATIGKREEIG